MATGDATPMWGGSFGGRGIALRRALFHVAARLRRRVGRAAHGLALAARAAIYDSGTDSTNAVIHELHLLMYMLYNTYNVLRKNMLCNQLPCMVDGNAGRSCSWHVIGSSRRPS